MPDRRNHLGRRAFLCAPAAFALAGCSRAGSAVGGYAFVANEEGRAVSVVRLGAFNVVKHLRVPAAPTALISHPTRPVVYALTPADGSLYEIGVESLTIQRKVRVAATATTMRLDPAGAAALWVLSSEANKLFRLPIDSLKPDAQIGLAAEASNFDLSPWTGLAGVGYKQGGAVQIIDLAKRKAGAPLRISAETGSVLFRSDGKALMVANTADRMLTIVQAPEARVMTNLPLAVRPDNLCVNRNGGQLFITGEGMDAVVVVYPHHVPQVAETALAGRAPGAMAVTDDYLFVTNSSTGEVTIMNVDTRRVIAVASVGAEPSFIAITPADAYALVLNRRSGDMAVIRIGTITRNRQKSVAILTMIPVGSKPVSAVATAV